MRRADSAAFDETSTLAQTAPRDETQATSLCGSSALPQSGGIGAAVAVSVEEVVEGLAVMSALAAAQ